MLKASAPFGNKPGNSKLQIVEGEFKQGEFSKAYLAGTGGGGGSIIVMYTSKHSLHFVNIDMHS